MERTLFYIVLSSILLAACGPSPEAIETAITQTQVAEVTKTPIPTNTKAKTPTPDIHARQEYLVALQPLMVEWLAEYSKFQQALDDFQNDILLINDEDWHLETKKALANMTTAAKKMEALPPPPLELKKLNEHLLGIVESTKALEQNWNLMISNPNDATYSDKTSAAVNETQEYFSLIIEELENISP